ncbi:MAG: hypothetical protein SF066_10105 [Thermoanaerobaculia bacterium]|nr:hypothetical protein [Thermoanaerobaculia bacterium]
MQVIRVSALLGGASLVLASAAFAAFPPSAAYPPALENPILEGSFTTPNEYRGANRVRDDLNVGWFYKQHRQNWTVNGVTYKDTITFFDTHLFTDKGYNTLDQYDMNSWEYAWGDVAVEVWVFLPGNNNDAGDHYWLDMSGIGSANYPTGFDDDGGFLVRLNYDPSTDKRWKPGMPKPGDAGWDFTKFYGVFAYGGINTSHFTKGYTTIRDKREIYEFSITLNRIPGTGHNFNDGGIPGVPQFGGGLGGPPGRGGGGGGTGGDDDEANPEAPGLCDPIWELRTKWKKVKDWKPSMGGHGELGGIGWIPDGTEWVFMGWDDSMHPTPEAVIIEPVDEVPIEIEPIQLPGDRP